MLLEKPIFYYKEILKLYPNSYLAEDERQVIVGINCAYFGGESLGELKEIFDRYKTRQISPFAGLFGVMSYNIVKTIEVIRGNKNRLYNFPNFYYANATSYLHYDKMSKIYTIYGDENKDLEKTLENLSPKIELVKEYSYKILTNLEDEKTHFTDMIAKAKDYIAKGDVFQVVLGEILSVETDLNSLDFYERLKQNNQSPYMFHFPTEFGDVVGSSPELVFELRDGTIFVAPIAGTRKRGKDATEDEKLKNELLRDEKELAEHKMLIDLARNDISRVAKPTSVSVSKAMSVVKYESVMHIISEVRGKIDTKFDAFDAFKSIFPAGTLSGSPKIRAMQIINELESYDREIYGGGLGFWHFNGDAQMAILIRSAIFSGSKAFIGAGAGIVYDSKATNEYDEICNKRNSCFKVIKELAKEQN